MSLIGPRPERPTFCVEFEKRIRGWDEYLTNSYGDYMQLPPEEDRWHHPQKTWRAK